MNNKSVLKQWIHLIGRKNLPINPNTCICSEHFERASNRLLRPDVVPSLRLPFTAANTDKRRKPPKDRPFIDAVPSGPSLDSSDLDPRVCDAAIQAGERIAQIEDALTQARKIITDPEKRLKEQDEKHKQ